MMIFNKNIFLHKLTHLGAAEFAEMASKACGKLMTKPLASEASPKNCVKIYNQSIGWIGHPRRHVEVRAALLGDAGGRERQ